MRTFWFILLIAMFGCSPTSDSRHAIHDSNVLDEAKVLAIAREAVATNDTWVESAEFEPPKRKPDGSWSVLVWRFPKTPGGHRLILIDEQGKVTEYLRGK